MLAVLVSLLFLQVFGDDSCMTVVDGLLTDGKLCSGAIAVPSSVTSVGESAFLGCRGITHVTIPPTVTSIAENAFYGCSMLEEM